MARTSMKSCSTISLPSHQIKEPQTEASKTCISNTKSTMTAKKWCWTLTTKTISQLDSSIEANQRSTPGRTNSTLISRRRAGIRSWSPPPRSMDLMRSSTVRSILLLHEWPMSRRTNQRTWRPGATMSNPWRWIHDQLLHRTQAFQHCSQKVESSIHPSCACQIRF